MQKINRRKNFLVIIYSTFLFVLLFYYDLMFLESRVRDLIGHCNYCSCFVFWLEEGDGDDRDSLHQNDKEIVRKELGLDWMLRPATRTVKNSHAQVEEETEETKAVEVISVLLLRISCNFMYRIVQFGKIIHRILLGDFQFGIS